MTDSSTHFEPDPAVHADVPTAEADQPQSEAEITDMEGNPLAPARRKRLHDDIMFDILGIVEMHQPVTVRRISEIFRDHDHRVDEFTINLALNKAVCKPTSLFYADVRAAIVTNKIIKPSFGKAPIWYVTFHPQAKALVVKKELPQIEQTDTKLDGSLDEINELLAEMAGRPGMQKRTSRLRDVIERGAIAVGQEKSSFVEKMDEQGQQLRLIMEKLGIEHASV